MCKNREQSFVKKSRHGGDWLEALQGDLNLNLIILVCLCREYNCGGVAVHHITLGGGVEITITVYGEELCTVRARVPLFDNNNLGGVLWRERGGGQGRFLGAGVVQEGA